MLFGLFSMSSKARINAPFYLCRLYLLFTILVLLGRGAARGDAYEQSKA